MATIELNARNFEATVDEGMVLVDWWAPWCGPCRAFAPVFDAAAERHADVTFAKVNTQDQPGLAQQFGVRAIPTLMAFRDGILVFEQPGMMPPRALEELLAQVRNLDMDAVRKAVDEQLAAGADALPEELR